MELSVRALIVDDEEKACNVLRTLIERYVPAITELEIVNSATDAYYKIKQYQPDLLFLDIQMPFLNGFDLLNKIENVNFDIIFTTAFNEYAIKAIRFSALDYLLKPIDTDELKNAVDRHIARRQTGPTGGVQYRNLVTNLSAKTNDEFTLAINGSQGMQFFKVDEIIRLEGDRNYTNFFFTKQRKYLSSKTLKEYEEILMDKGFVRVHKSHLVNSSFVQAITPEGKMVLKDQSEVEISRRRFQDIRKMFAN